MLFIVISALKGIELIPTKRLEKYMHAISGAVIFICGVSIQFLGL
jgi:hypothetical protein